MPIFVTEYINNVNSQRLSKEIVSNSDAIKLPHDPTDKNIFIRKKFASESAESWKVVSIDITNQSTTKTLCQVFLEPVTYSTESISERHGSNGSKLIRGRIAECDFGYFDQEVDHSLNRSKVIKDFNSPLPFEMVKRRMVVILSSKQDPALVVPLSTKSKAKDSNTVVEINSLPGDLVAFSEPVCFAKAASITLVSGHRLFPLRYYDGQRKVYDKRLDKKLSNADVVEIKKAVLKAVGGNNFLYDLETAQSEVKTLEASKQALELQIEELNQANQQLWDDLETATTPPIEEEELA